jgi:hypothetical protein
LAFHRIARRFAEAIAEQAGAGIDTGVYDRVRCFRAPNSRHPKTGLHKRRLTVEELMHLRLDAIQDAAKQPAPFDLPTPNATSNAAAELWSQSVTAVRAETEAKAERNAKGTADQLNRTTLEFIRNGAPEGDRHRLLYSASANLAELGAPLGLCVALLTGSALDCGLPPGDVRRAIENGHHGRAIRANHSRWPIMTQLAKYTIAADALTDWKDDLLSGKPPTLYNVGTGDLSRIEIGPGRVVLIGGVPGGERPRWPRN